MTIPPNPCYNCIDRYGGCHSECERYFTWAEARKEALAHYKKQENIDRQLREAEFRRNNMKRKGKM